LTYIYTGQQTVDSCFNGQNIISFFHCIAGNCFNHRINDMCYALSETDATEEQCSGPYYSDDGLKELDGYAYAEKCREVISK
jgi:hypothetical protein